MNILEIFIAVGIIIIISILVIAFLYERGFLKNLFDKKSRKFFTSTPLDAEQIEAAQYPYTKPLIVRAGPGSGKTRVVAERVKDLILEQNIDPDRILCLTFTKAGCEAMQKRLENDEDLKKNNVNFPKKQIRTYHSLCYNLLNLHSNETFNTKKIMIMIKKMNSLMI